MRASQLLPAVLVLLAFVPASVFASAPPTPTDIVKAFSLTGVRAWRRADGTTRFDAVVKNGSSAAYAVSMGAVSLQNYALTGSKWSPAGGVAVSALLPGATFERKNSPFTAGATATKLKVVVKFAGKDYASALVPIGAEPADVQSGAEMTARRILGAVTYAPFTARVYPDGKAEWRLVLRNNTDDAWTSSMGSLILRCYQGQDAVASLPIAAIPARGTVPFPLKSFTDSGENTFRALLTYDAKSWAEKTIPVAGAAERDSRAFAITKALTIAQFTPRRIGGDNVQYTLVVANPTAFAFSKIGRIRVVVEALVGSSWKTADGWYVDQIPAQGQATLTRKFKVAKATKLRVKLTCKTVPGPQTLADIP